MRTLLENISENRSEWLALREKTMGSSEITTILGLNQYSTPLQLWLKKTGRADHDKENDEMWLGSALEKTIGALYSRKTDRAVTHSDTLYAHDSHEWATASPDFLTSIAGIDGLVECKNVTHRSKHKWENGEVADYAHLQLMWQLGVLGLKIGSVAALVGGSARDFVYKDFEFSEKIFDSMLESASIFQEAIKSDVPPGALGGDIDYLNAIARPDTAKVIELPQNSESIILEFLDLENRISELNKAVKETEEKKKNLRALLTQQLGDANAGILGDYTVQLKTSARKSYTVEATTVTKFNVYKKKEAN